VSLWHDSPIYSEHRFSSLMPYHTSLIRHEASCHVRPCRCRMRLIYFLDHSLCKLIALQHTSMKATDSQSPFSTPILPLLSLPSNNVFVITVVSLTAAKFKTFNVFFVGLRLILRCRHAHFHDFVWLLLPACIITYRRYILCSTSDIWEGTCYQRYHTVSAGNYFPTLQSSFCS
jgi:hypothetical protein